MFLRLNSRNSHLIIARFKLVKLMYWPSLKKGYFVVSFVCLPQIPPNKIAIGPVFMYTRISTGVVPFSLCSPQFTIPISFQLIPFYTCRWFCSLGLLLHSSLSVLQLPVVSFPSLRPHRFSKSMYIFLFFSYPVTFTWLLVPSCPNLLLSLFMSGYTLLVHP